MRVSALSEWPASERSRVAHWFGRSDETTRTTLLNGLTRVHSVLRSLTPANFVRTGSDRDRATGCMPNPAGAGQEAAHVCAPDTATHTISISPKFCAMRQWTAYSDSRVSTVIHEVTHFVDTMATLDKKYTIVPQLMAWGQTNPDLAIINADSIAGYVVWGDH
ncbi:M35 family metallo-endopeptidase [Paraburkholderia sp. BL10I2N1]|uniref:M35 family metallo-endopeptidase n=1 Tax=Paraburkholderia sp. BL10I2N1 TaxID=1938796 RepID=UPI001FB804C2|nr:M35 family metallo-endopeptidase [Paraburkholderia sp. BL10I2N1]